MHETKTTVRTKPTKAKTLLEAVSQPTCTSGKLGQLVERLETAEGATLAELTELTGWQPHAVRAALTRLRQRHFKICLEARSGRKAYRLDAGEG
jgi:DNA-binding transcriptional regulator PaaX